MPRATLTPLLTQVRALQRQAKARAYFMPGDPRREEREAIRSTNDGCYCNPPPHATPDLKERWAQRWLNRYQLKLQELRSGLISPPLPSDTSGSSGPSEPRPRGVPRPAGALRPARRPCYRCGQPAPSFNQYAQPVCEYHRHVEKYGRAWADRYHGRDRPCVICGAPTGTCHCVYLPTLG